MASEHFGQNRLSKFVLKVIAKILVKRHLFNKIEYSISGNILLIDSIIRCPPEIFIKIKSLFSLISHNQISIAVRSPQTSLHTINPKSKKEIMRDSMVIRMPY